ncbi:zinc finger protein 383-like [Monodelphis domestica]|uniref:zinc finger protein 383-like n=1 Tax=Monodelphis domestica TaxID=13616 RepID=UPI0024E1E73A|nr:zinc finger protein 383-like [Monodelphis domestica]
MALQIQRLPSKELITFKDVVVDFTKEEWCLLDCSQKELCKEVMLENVQNLLSVGLTLPREYFITCLQQGESPWLPEKKCQWSFCLEEETNFEEKEISYNLTLFVEESGLQRCMNDGPCDFVLRDISNFDIKVNQNPMINFEFEETAENFRKCSGLIQNRKLTLVNEYAQDREDSTSFPTEVEFIPFQKKPPQMLMHQGNIGGIALARRLDLISHPKSKGIEMLSLNNIVGRNFSKISELGSHRIIHAGEKIYDCKPCGKAYTQRGNLATRQRMNTGEKLFECNECGKCFPRRYNLATHQRIHTGEKPVEHKQCGKAVIHRGNLSIHQRFHTGKKPFECKKCGNSFTQKVDLARHQRSHTGEKPYECKHGNLATHQRIHTGEKPVESKQCRKAVIHRGNLSIHHRFHTGKKPFECKKCGNSFTQKVDLARHQRMHTGEKPYERKQDNLATHQRIHTGEKPVERKQCVKAFTHRGNLYIHQRFNTVKKPFELEEGTGSDAKESVFKMELQLPGTILDSSGLLSSSSSWWLEKNLLTGPESFPGDIVHESLTLD